MLPPPYSAFQWTCEGHRAKDPRINPFSLKRYLDKLCGSVGDAKATREGYLLIVTLDKAQTEHLLSVTTMDGFPVTVSLSDKVKSAATI